VLLSGNGIYLNVSVGRACILRIHALNVTRTFIACDGMPARLPMMMWYNMTCFNCATVWVFDIDSVTPAEGCFRCHRGAGTEWELEWDTLERNEQ
jgi:hypothetical protein